MQVFSKQWFTRYHDWLLKLANTSYGRYVMGIDTDKVIARVTPNSYSVLDGVDVDSKTAQFTTRFTGRPRIALNLANNFGWLWKAMHALDSLFLDRQQLVPNFGFNTLNEFYSTTGTGPGNIDHNVGRSVPAGEYFGSLSHGNGTDVDCMSNYVQVQLASTADTNKYSWLQRSFLQFDTGTPIIAAGQLILANLKMYLRSVQGPTVFWTGSDQGLVLREHDGGQNGQASVIDFQNCDSKDKLSSELLYSSMTVDDWNTFAINVPGWDEYINKSGYTEMALLFVEDQPGWIPGGNSPTWASETNCRYQFDSADCIYDNDPNLEITTLGILKVNVGDTWKDSVQLSINIGDTWKDIYELKINIGDVWKVIF